MKVLVLLYSIGKDEQDALDSVGYDILNASATFEIYLRYW